MSKKESKDINLSISSIEDEQNANGIQDINLEGGFTKKNFLSPINSQQIIFSKNNTNISTNTNTQKSQHSNIENNNLQNIQNKNNNDTYKDKDQKDFVNVLNIEIKKNLNQSTQQESDKKCHINLKDSSKNNLISQQLEQLNMGEIKASEQHQVINVRRNTLIKRDNLTQYMKCPKYGCDLRLVSSPFKKEEIQSFRCKSCKKNCQSQDKIIVCLCQNVMEPQDVCIDCFNLKVELDQQLEQEKQQVIKQSAKKCNLTLKNMQKSCKNKCRKSTCSIVALGFFLLIIFGGICYVCFEWVNEYVGAFAAMISFILFVTYISFYLPERIKIIGNSKSNPCKYIIKTANSKDWCENCLKQIDDNNQEINKLYNYLDMK